jgi:hypothetical protein
VKETEFRSALAALEFEYTTKVLIAKKRKRMGMAAFMKCGSSH